MCRAIRAVFAALAILAVVACGGSTTDGSAGSEDPAAAPEIRSTASAPGDPLRDGFVVAEGTTLVGTPTPAGLVGYFQNEPVVDDGWSATFVVDGDPEAAMESYMRQAGALGLTRKTPTPSPNSVSPGSVEAPCVTDPQTATTDLPARYICRAVATGGTAGSPAPVVVVRTDRGPIADGANVNQLTLQYSTWEGASSASPAAYGVIGPLPDLPEGWATTVPTGESIPEGWPHLDGIEVVEGSVSAGPLSISSSCTQMSTALVVEVTGDPLVVFDAYRRQYETRVGTPSEEPLGPPEALPIADGSTLYRAYPGAIGGESLKISLVVKPDGRNWMTLESCND